MRLQRVEFVAVPRLRHRCVQLQVHALSLVLLGARRLLTLECCPVPKAMGKRMDQVLEELDADHALNAPPS